MMLDCKIMMLDVAKSNFISESEFLFESRLEMVNDCLTVWKPTSLFVFICLNVIIKLTRYAIY